MGPAKDVVQWRTLVLTTLTFKVLLSHCNFLVERQQLRGCIVLFDPRCVTQLYGNASYLILRVSGTQDPRLSN